MGFTIDTTIMNAHVRKGDQQTNKIYKRKIHTIFYYYLLENKLFSSSIVWQMFSTESLNSSA